MYWVKGVSSAKAQNPCHIRCALGKCIFVVDSRSSSSLTAVKESHWHACFRVMNSSLASGNIWKYGKFGCAKYYVPLGDCTKLIVISRTPALSRYALPNRKGEIWNLTAYVIQKRFGTTVETPTVFVGYFSGEGTWSCLEVHGPKMVWRLSPVRTVSFREGIHPRKTGRITQNDSLEKMTPFNGHFWYV